MLSPCREPTRDRVECMLLVLLAQLAVAAPVPTLQLVESWPAETSLDQPDIRDAHETWREMIRGAKESIEIAQFYLSPDPDAEDRMDGILVAIEAAALRGVQVKILADAKFAKTYPDDLARFEKMSGVEVRRYDMKPITGGVMHAKYFIVDAKIAYLGSQNFDWRSLEHIQELGVRFTGPSSVAALRAVFAQDWALAASAVKIEPTAVVAEPMSWRREEVTVRFVASPKELVAPSTWDLPYILGAINDAKATVRVQLLGYAVVGYDKSEWRDIDDALRAAGARGVKVQLLVSNWQKAAKKQQVVKDLTAADGVEVRFANIPEHSTGWQHFSRTIHSKYMVVDGAWSWVGTSNWSKDYFHSSRNVGLIVEGAPFASRLDQLHTSLWDSDYAEPVDAEKSYMSPFEVRKASTQDDSPPK